MGLLTLELKLSAALLFATGGQGLPGAGKSFSDLLISFLQVRALVADFSIIFSILLFCGVDACFGLATPKLLVPSVIKVCPGPLLCAFSPPAHQLQILSPLC